MGGEVERGRAGHRQPLGAAARTEEAAAAALPPATSDSALRLPPPLWPAPPMTSARACAAVESGRSQQRRAFACPQRAAQLRWLGIRAIAAACAPYRSTQVLPCVAHQGDRGSLPLVRSARPCARRPGAACPPATIGAAIGLEAKHAPSAMPSKTPGCAIASTARRLP